MNRVKLTLISIELFAMKVSSNKKRSVILATHSVYHLSLCNLLVCNGSLKMYWNQLLIMLKGVRKPLICNRNFLTPSAMLSAPW